MVELGGIEPPSARHIRMVLRAYSSDLYLTSQVAQQHATQDASYLESHTQLSNPAACQPTYRGCATGRVVDPFGGRRVAF